MIKVYKHSSTGTSATTIFKLEAENITQVTQTKEFSSPVSILKVTDKFFHRTTYKYCGKTVTTNVSRIALSELNQIQ
jgi:hypothetical protein